METFSVEILGCKVNQYEGEQLAALLRSRGLRPTRPVEERADLRIVHTCSVTVQAAARSRQLARQSGRAGGESRAPAKSIALPQLSAAPPGAPRSTADLAVGGRVVVTGCWATSNRAEAAALAGVDAVIGHDQDVAFELSRLLDLWQASDVSQGSQGESPRSEPPGVRDTRGARGTDQGWEPGCQSGESIPGRGQGSFRPTPATTDQSLPEPFGNEGWMNKAGSPEGERISQITPSADENVNGKMAIPPARGVAPAGSIQRTSGRAKGTTSLPLLSERQPGRQRAHLKVQDGCDAHCTYCIIPRLRGRPWSKPIEDAVTEARRLVAAGHVELVLTGIFLGAYGRETALRRRQERGGNRVATPLARLVEALCREVEGLRRLRFSSLEPGDLDEELVAALRAQPQVVPHFHLPLQSGSDALLRRMNRQYGRDDYLHMVERVRTAFDRPALTTDVIVGFPGESEEEFHRTLEVVDFARFIHIHAFSFSPRPGTAAARWTRQFVHGPVVNERIHRLRRRAEEHSLTFRRQFLGQTVELLVERDEESERTDLLRHGRSQRYFAVHFDDLNAKPGDFVRVRVEHVLPDQTLGVREQLAVGGEAASETGRCADNL